MRIVVTGATGFVGSATIAALKEAGQHVVAVSAPRLSVEVEDPDDVVARAADFATKTSPDLDHEFNEADVVVNCAGAAVPDSRRTASLLGANAALPALLYLLALRNGVSRFVHVSSAAVQGRRPVLDETFTHEIRSPYAESKALGETALTLLEDSTCGLRIYRATSVQEFGRGVTNTLLRLAHLPVVPLVGDGDHPLPLALRSNCAAAIAHLATTEQAPSMNLHPWEAMTPRRFFRLVNPHAWFMHLPSRLAKVADEALWQLGRHSAPAAAMAKRADLLVAGQRSTATAMAGTGFTALAGDSEYRTMGVAWRRQLGEIL